MTEKDEPISWRRFAIAKSWGQFLRGFVVAVPLGKQLRQFFVLMAEMRRASSAGNFEVILNTRYFYE